MIVNAQGSKITLKPAGYQMTINAKETGMPLQYKQAIAKCRLFLEMYNLPDSTIYEEVINKLSYLEIWIARLIPQLPGLKIDVIGQTHLGGAENDAAYQVELLSSQSLVNHILLSNKYAIVGNEGNMDTRITKEIVIKGTEENLGKRNQIKVDSIDQGYSTYGAYGQVRTGVHSLLFTESLGSQVMGIEDSTMYYLHGLIIKIPEFMQLSDLVSTLRSYVAFFKVAEQLIITGQKQKKAAIVIGSNHLRDFIWLTRTTGTESDFYHTSNGDFFEKIAQSRDPMF